MKKKFMTVMTGVFLGMAFFTSNAFGAVTMVTPSSGPLPRVLEFLGDGYGQVHGCYAGTGQCALSDVRTVQDGAGKYHYYATAWVTPTGPITIRVSEDGVDQYDFTYTVTSNGVNPFGLQEATLELSRVGKNKGQALLDSYYYMTIDSSYVAAVEIRRRSGNRWKAMKSAGGRKAASVPGSILGTPVSALATFDLAALKKQSHQIVVTYRVPGTNLNIKRKKFKLSRKDVIKGKKRTLMSPTPTPLYP